MTKIRLGVTTQTPLVRPGDASKGRGPARLTVPRLRKDNELHVSPGGVTRMVLPELRLWSERGWTREAHWFSLQPIGPRELRLRDPPLRIHHLSLPRPHLLAYARTKEKLWNTIHGIEQTRFDTEDFRFYTHYNWFTTNALLERLPSLDIAYVHDFQLLQMGAMIGLAAPSVFRWHVPFNADHIPSYTRNFLVRAMEDYDAVIVSTHRDLEGLSRAGFHGLARQVYPHIDPADWPKVPQRQVDALEAELGLKPDDPVIVKVARMDPIKRHDLAIRAFARIVRKHPRARLVLVGNGSFSGATRGGLGIGKSHRWARRLQRLAKSLRIEHAVIFAHWITDKRLAAVYARADAVLLASDVEGFGLTVFEAWRYGKSTLVSSGAGVAEVVHDGFDGYVFPAGDANLLAERLDYILTHRNRREAVGSAAQQSLAYYDVHAAAPRIRAILEGAIEGFGAR